MERLIAVHTVQVGEKKFSSKICDKDEKKKCSEKSENEANNNNNVN